MACGLRWLEGLRLDLCIFVSGVEVESPLAALHTRSPPQSSKLDWKYIIRNQPFCSFVADQTSLVVEVLAVFALEG